MFKIDKICCNKKLTLFKIWCFRKLLQVLIFRKLLHDFYNFFDSWFNSNYIELYRIIQKLYRKKIGITSISVKNFYSTKITNNRATKTLVWIDTVAPNPALRDSSSESEADEDNVTLPNVIYNSIEEEVESSRSSDDNHFLTEQVKPKIKPVAKKKHINIFVEGKENQCKKMPNLQDRHFQIHPFRIWLHDNT